MSKKLLSLVLMGLLGMSLAACSSDKATEELKNVIATEEVVTEETAAPEMLAAGENTLGFPSSDTDLVAGDHAFTPDYDTATKLKTKGGDVTYINYNFVEVVTPGDLETTVKDSWGSEGKKEYVVPNSFMIPVPKGAKASKGDIVITPWVTSMMRALVTEGDKTTTPKVTWIEDVEDIKKIDADTFVVLSKEWQGGTTVACKGDGSDYELATLISMVGDDILASGWANSPKIYSKSKCKAVPIAPSVKEGDTVYIAPFGTFEAGTVKAVKADDGKVVVEYEFAGEMKEEKFTFGDILLSL